MCRSWVLRVLPLVPVAFLECRARAADPLQGAPDASVAHPKVAAGPLWSPVRMGAKALMVYPAPGDSDVNFWQPFAWTTVAGAQTYRLLVGTAPGLGDVFDSGETPRTSLWLPLLPAGSYYGRIATNVAERWAFGDFLFGSSGYPTATIRSPANGSVVDAGRTVFSWDAVPNATAYRLVVGTAYGASNMADSGFITASSFEVPPLPRDVLVYARLFTNKWDAWRFTEAVFSTGPSLLPTLVKPVDGAEAIDTGIPFEWRSTVFSSSYRLEIGTSTGANDLHDSGEISVLTRFVGSLPLGQTLYGRLSARFDDVWAPVDFRFTVGSNGSAAPHVVPAALGATDFVRGMANDANVPISGTPLGDLVAAEGQTTAFCNDYANALLHVLQQMNVSSHSRILNVCLKANWYDCHTLVELQEPLLGTWMLLDPTFDLTVRRFADGGWATASDVSQATRTMSFSDVSYQFLGSRGSDVARGYYLDYPLLYLVVCGETGLEACPNPYPSSLSYMELVSMPVDSGGLYAIQGTPSGSVGAMVDGAEVQLTCDPVDGLTYVFWAQSIDSLPGSSIQVFRPHRFVF